jgi:protein-S-isoprenylcysteine O-methyltransferase Ste14
VAGRQLGDSLLTLVIFPVLVWMYVGLARREEREARAGFGEEYARYAQRIPGFIPRLGGCIAR